MANDFSGLSSIIGLWNFDTGTATTDSSGNGNTLTDNNTVGTNTVDQEQGTACADFEQSNSEYYSRTQANLSSNFIAKDGSSNRTFTFTGWTQLESLSGSNHGIMQVAGASNVRFICEVTRTDHPTNPDELALVIGYNSGASNEFKFHGTTLSAAEKYFIAIRFNGSTKGYSLGVYKKSTATWLGGGFTEGTFTNNMYIGASGGPDFAIGLGFTGSYMDGLGDEFMLCGEWLSDGDVNNIRDKIYGAAVGFPVIDLYYKTLLQGSR